MASECRKSISKDLKLKPHPGEDALGPPTGDHFGSPYLEPPSLGSCIHTTASCLQLMFKQLCGK